MGVFGGVWGVLGPPWVSIGGSPDWETKFPKECTVDSPFAPCESWCDKQSCDQCHPNDDGYTKMAGLIAAGLGLGDASIMV